MNAPSNPADGKFTCPCCGYLIHGEHHAYDICPICFWEDCPDQAFNPDDAGGPNHTSLREAQRNFRDFGGCERETLQYCRKPTPEDKRDPQWVPLTDGGSLRNPAYDGPMGILTDYTGPNPDGK